MLTFLFWPMLVVQGHLGFSVMVRVWCWFFIWVLILLGGFCGVAVFCRGIVVQYGMGVFVDLLLYVSSEGLVMSAYNFWRGGWFCF